MFIRALNVLGVMALDGTCPIWAGSVAEVDDATGKRLVGMGAAVDVGQFDAQEAAGTAPGDRTGTSSTGSQNAPEGPQKPDTETETEIIEEELEGRDLESMSFNDLKAYAKELGIETKALRSRASLIEAISALAEVGIPTDDLPDLTAQDVVE